MEAFTSAYGLHVLSQLTPEPILSFIGRPQLRPATRAAYFSTIRAFCRWAIRMELLDRDPTALLPVPKRPRNLPRPVSTDHLELLLATCTRPRTRAYVTLAAYAGLRVHEIAKIRGEDVDKVARTITVVGKGSRVATIPVHPVVLELAKLFPQRGLWFPSPTRPHQPVTSRAVSSTISQAMQRAGVPGTPHALRHWYGTTLHEAGVDIRVIQELMRHEQLSSTAIYTRVRPGTLAAAVIQLPHLLGP